jgi:hypothetical protein
MSYIGAQPTTGSFPFDQFSGNGSTTAFTLTYAPASTTSIIVAISGVVQNPTLYSIVGTTLTFSPAPPTGTNNISVLYLGLPVQIGTPIPGSTLQLALGSAANPSLTFIGDTNTGIYSPGADTIAFVEGGTEAMWINSSANVGIGTSSPLGRLHSRWDAGAGDGFTGKNVFSTTDQALYIKTYWQSGVGQHTTLEASNLANSAVTDLRLNGSTLQFLAGSTEQMRIASSGAVSFGSSGTAFGTSGQVLTSNGSGSAPSFQTVSGIGVGQTWTNVTGSRATGTTYTNSTGKPIMVVVTPVASGGLIGTFNISGSAVGVVQFTPSGGGGGSPFFYIIPNGVTYSVTNNSNFNINYWWELR